MANILFIYPRKMVTIEDMHNIFTSEEAKKLSFNARFETVWTINKSILEWADVLVFVRNLDLISQWVLKKAHKKGYFIIQFFDDDLLGLPRSAVNRVQFLKWRKKAVKSGFENTDVILSSNFMLAQKYAKMIPSGRFANIDTVVPKQALMPLEENKSNQKVKIVFAAGANHEKVFNDYISPVIPRLAKECKKQFSFTFFGVHPDVPMTEGNVEVEYIGAMPLLEYRKKIQEGKYDIGLAPLEHNDFTQYKYFNKFIEYTIAGASAIYSKVPPYTLVIEEGKNGFFAENTTESWFKVLKTVIENDELRINAYKNAYKHILQNMNPKAIFKKLYNDIPELTKHNTDKKAFSITFLKIKFFFFRTLEFFYLIFEYLRTAGIKGTVEKVLDYHKDKKIAKKEQL
ncbi:Glycosyl transferases group 1 [Treponema bryantii]|uniref:Glycosyl transferases group 1 n=1 Tax=Treponema bryantii TaxID=163 RepID=A0A1I3NAF0_9SPIR|nr:glycosyltransferase [Treponema bryantii]SFJ05796.1 Glycosyl transferases group 1 [Treponema bryantii]